MTSRPRAQRLAEHLIRRACRRLPHDTRDDRYREWTAELHAILHDPGTRPQARRTLRALVYAADHARSTRRLPATAGHPKKRFLSTRYSQLLPAAPLITGLGTGTAILIWSPSHGGLANAIFASSMTVSVVLQWRARRRPRHKMQ